MNENLDEEEKVTAAMTAFLDSKDQMAGNTTVTKVKIEPGASGASGSADKQDGGPEAEREKEIQESLDAWKTDSKRVLRNFADAVMKSKEMFEGSSGSKYLVTINEDLRVLLPKVSKLYKFVENCHLRKEADPAILLANCTNIVDLFAKFNAISD